MAWSPLAGGRLATGDGIRPELLDVLDGLAKREGIDRSQMALAFVLAHPTAPTRDHRIAERRPHSLGDSPALGVHP